MELYQKIKQWSEELPKKPFLVCNEKSMTYKELEEYSNAMSVYIDENLGDDLSPVVVYGHMESEMLVIFLSVVKTGRAYIPIDVSIPEERIKKIIEDSNARMVISPKKVPSFCKMSGMEVIEEMELKTIWNEYHGKSLKIEKAVKENEIFYIIYTSGSTGNPKGVQISYWNLMSFVQWMTDDFGLIEKNIFMNQAPFSFDLSVMDIYPSLFLGATIWSITKEMVENPKSMFDSFVKSKMNVWISTPSFADMCLTDPQFNKDLLPYLEIFLFCGETLTNETAKKLMERFPQSTIYNTYGPTEATVAVTSIRLDEDIISKYEAIPIGKVKNDTEIVIVDKSMKRVLDGERGQMLIVGPSVSKGYLNRKEITEKSFLFYQGMPAYKTGDIGFVKDGYYFYGGRMDFQVKLNGYRMEIEEIEFQLRGLDLVENAVIIPIMKDGKCHYLTAVLVVGKHSFEKEFHLTSALKKELQKKIPSYMIPRKFQYVESLPMNANGKVDRKKIMSEVDV